VYMYLCVHMCECMYVDFYVYMYVCMIDGWMDVYGCMFAEWLDWVVLLVVASMCRVVCVRNKMINVCSCIGVHMCACL
jgi:hypothetical protein